MKKFLIGFFLGIGLSASAAYVSADVTTNGRLSDYIVQKNGLIICKDPTAFAKPFRGENVGYIICE